MTIEEVADLYENKLINRMKNQMYLFMFEYYLLHPELLKEPMHEEIFYFSKERLKQVMDDKEDRQKQEDLLSSMLDVALEKMNGNEIGLLLGENLIRSWCDFMEEYS